MSGEFQHNLFDTIAELDKRDEFLGMMAARFTPEGQFGYRGSFSHFLLFKFVLLVKYSFVFFLNKDLPFSIKTRERKKTKLVQNGKEKLN